MPQPVVSGLGQAMLNDDVSIKLYMGRPHYRIRHQNAIETAQQTFPRLPRASYADILYTGLWGQVRSGTFTPNADPSAPGSPRRAGDRSDAAV